MTYLLFPGRHLLHTSFQEQYLRQVLQAPLAQLDWWQGVQPAAAAPLNHIIFAITSANQQHSRYNPIPLHVRAIGVDRFARTLEMALDIHYRIVGIPHYQPTPRFAGYVLKEIEEQTEGRLQLSPENCVVLSSTEAVIEQYQALGFAILPAERGQTSPAPTPMAIIQRFVSIGEQWTFDQSLRAHMAPSSYDLWHDFPDVPRRILRIWREPLLNDSGGLTETRDYHVYAIGMANNDIIQLKYQDVKPAIVPGKIVDEGCADGALLALIARDFPDSDLIGIEITGEFIAHYQERQRAGDFGGSFVHFHQRNITHILFAGSSIDTTLCNSTVHELWSYGEGEVTVHDYFRKKYAQTAPGGRLIIRDVVGPADPDREVYLWLNFQDGSRDRGQGDPLAEFEDPADLAKQLAGLSTRGRFLRFCQDFLAAERASGKLGPETQIRPRLETIDGKTYAVLTLREAAEFISKKDYVENWQSEMHEEFVFWSFAQWKAALSDAGFHLLENPNAPAEGSRVYLNPWLVENRYQGKVALFSRQGDALVPLPFPPSNVVLVAEKR